MQSDPKPDVEFCEICHVGSLRPYRATYARWHDGQFVVVPGLPAWRCDVCGDTFYDNSALAQLALLLGPEVNVEDQKGRRSPGLDDGQRTGLGDRRMV